MLSNSGHNAAMVNPPSNPKATFRLASSNPPDHREWLAQGQLVARLHHLAGGAERRDEASPAHAGNTKYRPLCPAPGTDILQC
ncbi:MAG: hypothetical protein ACLP5E_02710 [Streptosporangiaceae bacterium]